MNKNLSANLSLLRDLTKREFKMRYLGSLLGASWNLIHPLVMILVYTLVFSQVMHARLGSNAATVAGQKAIPFAYSLYLCSGLLAWTFFQETVARGVNALVDNAAFLKKLVFPPVVLFGATLASAAINFFIAFGLFTLFLFAVKPIGLIYYFSFLLVVAFFAIFALGLIVGLGCLNVFLRDVQQLVGVVFQLWFWFTPVVYLVDALPEFARRMLVFNPAYAFIQPMHELLYFERFPATELWGLMVFWMTTSVAFGAFIYRRSISLVRDQL